ncbi:MAG: hypothetical protein JW892_13370 [Anaerolineae bacterium]|nr:hypothetical protein [Anaerolineae bacterium]
MNQHLTENDLSNYTLNMLTDADREMLSRHLQICPTCRAALAEKIQQQAEIQACLDAEIATLSPSSRMTFEAIAPAMLKSRRANRSHAYLDFFRAYGPALAAATGVILAVAGLFRNVTWPAVGLQQNHSLTLPFTAGIMFSLPVLSHYGQNALQRRPLAWMWVVSLALWLGTAVLGLYEIALLREMVLRAYIRFGPPSSLLLQQAQALGSWGVFFMGALWVAVVIGGGEFHYRHAGQQASWRLFGLTVLVQLSLLALPLLI